MIKVNNQLNLCKGGDFPGSPVVKTSLSSVGSVSSTIPDLVAKSPGAWQPKRKKQNKPQNIETIKTLKNGPC